MSKWQKNGKKSGKKNKWQKEINGKTNSCAISHATQWA